VLFKKTKKINEDDYDEELVEKPLRRRPKSKDFKDLKSENKQSLADNVGRRKRKEPPREWSRIDRILLLTLLIFTAGTSFYLALDAREGKFPGLPKFGIPKISSPFWGEETIVITGKKKDEEKALEVTQKFKDATSYLSGVYGFYVIELSSGFTYGEYEDEVFEAASLIKLPVIVGMFMEAEKGNIDLDTKYKLTASDKVVGSGSLYGKPVGYETTYRNLVGLMGKQSDNTAFNICRKLLGEEKIKEIISDIGLTSTNLAENATTPKDIGVIFEKLWKASLPAPERSNPSVTRGETLRAGGGQTTILTEKSANEILGYLTDTVFENWLAGGVPENIRVAHKYGREVHVVNDGGIIYADLRFREPQGSEKDLQPGGGPYVAVIMTKGVVEKEADEVIPKLSEIIYQGETSVK